MQKQLRDRYDWIVIGTHPGALLTASWVAGLGRSVLVVPMQPLLLRKYSCGGQYFDPESSFHLSLGGVGEQIGLTARCLKQMGVDLEVFRKKWIRSTEKEAPWILSPNLRFKFEEASLEAELSREFGKKKVDQLGLVHALKKTGMLFLSSTEILLDRVSARSSDSGQKEPVPEKAFNALLRDFAKKSKESRKTPFDFWWSEQLTLDSLGDFLAERAAQGRKQKSDFQEFQGFQAACEGLWYGLTSGVNANPSLLEMIQAFSLSQTGAMFKGGTTAYREFLMDLAQEKGAYIARSEDCRKLFVEKGRFVGIQTLRGQVISGDGAVIGCSILRAYERLKGIGSFKQMHLKESPTPEGWKFTLSMTVHQEAFPTVLSSTASRVFWKEKDAPVLEMELIHPSDYGLNQSGTRILHIRTVLPFSDETLDTEYQKRLAGRMFRKVLDLFPFMEFHVQRIYPDFRSTLQSSPFDIFALDGSAPKPEPSLDRANQELAEVYGFKTLGDIPDNLLVYGKNGLGFESGITNLFVASDQSYPTLGSLGGTVAALEAVYSMR